MRFETNSSGIGFSVSGGRDMPKGKVLARLGSALCWLGCVLGAIVLVWGAVFWLRGDSVDDAYLFAAVAVAAFAIWVIGLACRDIFSGK
jgi:hypothetical protein